eukprot:8870-Heterococcus_DN1.PRE.2
MYCILAKLLLEHTVKYVHVISVRSFATYPRCYQSPCVHCPCLCCCAAACTHTERTTIHTITVRVQSVVEDQSRGYLEGDPAKVRRDSSAALNC